MNQAKDQTECTLASRAPDLRETSCNHHPFLTLGQTDPLKVLFLPAAKRSLGDRRLQVIKRDSSGGPDMIRASNKHSALLCRASPKHNVDAGEKSPPVKRRS
jgi:hypothetical protein